MSVIPAECVTYQDVLRVAQRVRAFRQKVYRKPEIPAALLDYNNEQTREKERISEIEKSDLDQIINKPPTVRPYLTYRTTPMVADVLQVCAAHWGCELTEITGDKRSAKIMRPRQVTYYLLSKLTQLSLPEMGKRIGGRDHTTVLHGIRKITGLLERGDTDLYADIVATKAKCLDLVRARNDEWRKSRRGDYERSDSIQNSTG